MHADPPSERASSDQVGRLAVAELGGDGESSRRGRSMRPSVVGPALDGVCDVVVMGLV